jgi:hypothetical protein
VPGHGGPYRSNVPLTIAGAVAKETANAARSFLGNLIPGRR